MAVLGHSAGGHLTAMLLATDWADPEQDYCLQDGHVPFRVCIPVSGIFDLEPIRHSCVNQESNLHLENDPEQTKRNSPIHFLEQTKRNCASVQVTVVVASGDSPEFRRQSREYQAALKSGKFVEVPGRDHFSIIEQLDDPSDDFTQLVIHELNSIGKGDAARGKSSSLLPLLALGAVIAVCAWR